MMRTINHPNLGTIVPFTAVLSFTDGSDDSQMSLDVPHVAHEDPVDFVTRASDFALAYIQANDPHPAGLVDRITIHRD